MNCGKRKFISSLVSFLAISIATIAFLHASSAIAESKPDYKAIRQQLKSNMCVDPKLSNVMVRVSPTTDSNTAGAGPSPMEASSGCLECDVTQAMGPSKLKSLEANVSSIGKVIDESVELERIKRDIAYFEYVENFSEGSLGSIRLEIKAQEAEMEHLKNLIAQVASQIEAEKSFEGPIDDFAAGRKDLSTEQRQGLAKSLSESVEEFRTLKKENPIEYDSFENIAIGLLTGKKPLKPSKSQKQVKLEKDINKKMQYMDAVNDFVAWAKGDGRAHPPDVSILAVQGWLKADSESLKERTRNLFTQIIKNESHIADLKKEESKLKKANVQNETTALSQDPESLRKRLAAYEKAHEQDEIMRSANANNGFKYCGMTVAEIHSIVNYTMFGYQSLNQALRQGGESRATHKPFEEILNSALEKLQSYDDLVKRGGNLPPAILATHNVGNIVTYPSFTSTSVGYGFDGDHTFVIKSKTGKYIGPLSSSPDEEEVLFKSGARFKVLDRKEKSNGEIEFVMEEIAD